MKGLLTSIPLFLGVFALLGFIPTLSQAQYGPGMGGMGMGGGFGVMGGGMGGF